MQNYEPVDFTDLVYTAGTVFENMDATRDQTEKFLRTGDLVGLRRPERELLLDFRSAAEHLIQSAPADIDATYVISVNRRFGRTGSQRAGELRRLPDGAPAISLADLEDLVEHAFAYRDPLAVAVKLGSNLARVRPFEGANRRTAWLTAAAVLLPFGFVMPVPMSPGFTDTLERGAASGDMSSVEATMRSGIVYLYAPVVRRHRPGRPKLSERTPRDPRETDALLESMEEEDR